MSWNHLCPSCPTWCCRSPSPCEQQRKGKLVISGQSLQMSKTGTALAPNSLPMPFPALHKRSCVLKTLGLLSAILVLQMLCLTAQRSPLPSYVKYQGEPLTPCHTDKAQDPTRFQSRVHPLAADKDQLIPFWKRNTCYKITAVTQVPTRTYQQQSIISSWRAMFQLPIQTKAFKHTGSQSWKHINRDVHKAQFRGCSSHHRELQKFGMQVLNFKSVLMKDNLLF